MANEIEIYKGEQGDTSRVNFERDLSQIAGHYFRTVSDIPARKETSKEKAHRFHGVPENVDEFGMKTVTYEARRAVKGDLTLLVVKLRFLDDVLHSVVVAAHPTDEYGGNLVFMADEFFTYFVPADDGEEVRQQEINEVTSRIQSIQQKLMAPPPSANQALLAPPTLQQPTTTQLVAALQHRENLEERANAIAVQAQEHQKFLTEGTQEIMANTTLLTKFYQEKAEAALARVGDQIKYAKDLKEGLTTLSLYTGEEVEVDRLVEGESADPSEPLTLYQQVLYLDEELATESVVGGFDFKNMESLGEMLSRDNKLISRMIPAQRGAVLVQVRGESKRYFDDPAMALVEAAMNAKNRQRFLLVRDGENISLVYSEITSQNAPHLFPTRKEIDELFQRYGRDIRPEHLDYAHAKGAFEEKTVFYKRMILMLWGVSDRLNLFGKFYDPAVFNNWYDGDFQSQRIVYLYDGEGTLEMKRPSFLEWVEKQNGNIQVGSRIITNYAWMISLKSAPACFVYKNHDGSRDQSHFPRENFEVKTIQKDGDRLIIKVDCKKGYAGDPRKDISAKVDVVEGLQYTTAALCIDKINVEELDYYLNSRKERRNYEVYFELFKRLRILIGTEEAIQSTAIGKLIEDLSHVITDKEKAEELIFDAVALWRTQNNSRLVGADGWTPTDHDLVLNIAYALSGAQQDLLGRAKADIDGCSPIEIRIDGNGNFWLYREPNEEELNHPTSKIGVAHVARQRLRVGKTKVSTIGEAKRVYISNPPFNARHHRAFPTTLMPVREVSVAVDEDLKAKWEGKNIAGWETFENMQVFYQLACSNIPRYLKEMDVDAMKRDTKDLIIAHSTKREVAGIDFNLPLAVVSSRLSHNTGLFLLVMGANAMDALASMEELGGFGLAYGLARSIYKYPDTIMDRVRERLSKSTLGLPYTFSLMPIESAKKVMREGSLMPYGERNIHLSRSSYGHRSSSNKHAQSIHESIRKTLNQYDSEANELVEIHWMNEDNRVFAEEFFAAGIPKEA